jgi:amidophosphoribosyltransferase
MANSIIISEKAFSVHEECGIFGITSKEKRDLARDIYYGLFALQHRGQESAGIAVKYGHNVAYYKNMGLVSEVFGEEELKLLPASDIGIGHVRYSTTGSSNVINAQPVVFYGRQGRMAVAHNGNIVNAGQIKEKMIRAGHIFQSSIDSEVIAALINFYAGESIEEGILKACGEMIGAYALVILAGETLYAVRDPNGIRPLVMGENKAGDKIFASESCALDAVEANLIRDVKPGEIIAAGPDGSIRSFFIPNGKRKSCIFEYVYLARSDSVIDGVSVYDARYECGRLLAKLKRIDADIVAGVPDSALVSARGYSDFSGIPYVDALSKNRYVGRSFIQPSQSLRESSVKIKLNAFRSNIKGKRLVLIDDSIVRGTTSKKIIRLLRLSGAREVHMLVASPIVKFPCYFGVDMDTPEQLIGSKRTLEEIRAEIGADSLDYISLEDLKRACQSEDGEFCMGCFDGKYAVGDVNQYLCRKDILEC